MAVCPRDERPALLARAAGRLAWPNGAVSLLFSAEEPDRLRGKQSSGSACRISTCVAYPFTPLGVGVGAPVAAQLSGGVPLDLGAVDAAPALADDFGALVGAVSGALDLGLT